MKEQVWYLRQTRINTDTLLYDEETQKRIELIKLYQQLGFKIKEIKELIDAPNEVVKEALEKQVLCLKAERVRIDVLIKKLMN